MDKQIFNTPYNTAIKNLEASISKFKSDYS